MKKYKIYAIILVALILLLIILYLNNQNILKNNPWTNKNSSQNNSQNNTANNIIKVPAGFNVNVFAENLVSPRFILVKNNTVFVGSRGPKIYALVDNNSDNKADKVITFMDGLDTPNSIDYYDGWYYIAQTKELIRVRDDNNDLVADKNSLQKLR